MVNEKTETGTEVVNKILKKRATGSKVSGPSAAAKDLEAVISAPNMKVGDFHIKGSSPLVMHKFPKKAREMMKAAQEAGSQAKSKKKREPRDFTRDFEEAKHISEEGWYGIPATAFRGAMVSACKVAGSVMTRAKLAVFVLADGYDADDGTPLVRLEAPNEPEWNEAAVRLESGVADIRVRPMWREWGATVRIRWDGDMLSHSDVANLLMRAGMQVGILEGRADSRKSVGQGWGMFDLVNDGD
jgi:hypothetical protein